MSNLYNRDYNNNAGAYSTQGAMHRSEEETVSFVKTTYKLFAASMLSGAVGAYVGMGMAATIAQNYWFIAIPWLLFGVFGMGLVKNKPGINMIALFIFTFVGGLIITPLMSKILMMPGGSGVVVNAFLTTTAIFGALSLFAIKTTKDFTGYGKPLMIAFLIAIVGSLLNAFIFGSPALFVLIEVAFLMIISFMVLFDTQNIINGLYESPVDGAIALYLDFFNLFVTLLQLFGIFGSSDD